jgi:hypothetical protein
MIYQAKGSAPEVVRLIQLHGFNADEAADLLDASISNHGYFAPRSAGVMPGVEMVYMADQFTPAYTAQIQILYGEAGRIDEAAIEDRRLASWKDLIWARVLAFGRDPVNRGSYASDPKDFLVHS